VSESVSSAEDTDNETMELARGSDGDVDGSGYGGCLSDDGCDDRGCGAAITTTRLVSTTTIATIIDLEKAQHCTTKYGKEGGKKGERE
jgi:hypothetical protein